MSKLTLALVAAGGAAAGAVATAALYGPRRQTLPGSSSPPSPPSSTSNTLSSLPPTGSPTSTRAFHQQQQSATAAAPVDPSGIFQYGFPGPISDLRPALALTSSFNRQTRNPHWVAEHITPASLALRNGDRRYSDFVEDESIPDRFRARLRDYSRSGYDRGHQVPAADAKWSQAATDDTFALSNMCPQVGQGFNRDYWAHLEDFCRRLVSRYPSVRIVTGPLYLPKRDDRDGKWRVSYEVIGNPPNVAVPTHFYKVIYAEDGREGGQVALGAFVLPNAVISNSKPLADFEVPIEAVERASGLEFVKLLPPARRKRLCADVTCSIIVKEYKERQKVVAAGSMPTQ